MDSTFPSGRRVQPTPAVRRAIANIHLLARQEGLGVGDRMPSERALSSMLFASRSTIRQALALMREDGDIVTHPGRSGSWISRDIASKALSERVEMPTSSTDLIDRPSGSTLGLPITLASQGLSCVTTVLDARIRECPEAICTAFALPAASTLIRIERVRTVGGDPVSYERTYINQRDYPDFLDQDLTQSIFQLLQGIYGERITTVEESIEVAPGLGRCAQHLRLQPGSSLLRVCSKACDAQGRTVVVSRDAYPASKVRLTTFRTLP